MQQTKKVNQRRMARSVNVEFQTRARRVLADLVDDLRDVEVEVLRSGDGEVVASVNVITDAAVCATATQRLLFAVRRWERRMGEEVGLQPGDALLSEGLPASASSSGVPLGSRG